MKGKRILIDGREFSAGRLTGIGRVLEGLVYALVTADITDEIILATHNPISLPLRLKSERRIRTQELPDSFVISEKVLTELTMDRIGLFISPYPKLPLFGCHSASAHFIHDILDLTHQAYKRRFKAIFDRWRLKRALKIASLTWYDSQSSLAQTRNHTGLIGKNPKVRYPGLHERFVPDRSEKDPLVWKKYGLRQGYVLALGNGLPHKNLGVLLEIADKTPRQIVLAGVPSRNQKYWVERYRRNAAAWIHYVADEDLPSLLRGAFCLVQPSTAEGYGYPPLEAMACGIPSVISNISVLKETAGGDALIAEANKPEKWLDALRSLESETFYRDQVGKGLRWVNSRRGQNAWIPYIADIEEILAIS
jgi:glycosyltransferase involved in cell wall biosynthesis